MLRSILTFPLLLGVCLAYAQQLRFQDMPLLDAINGRAVTDIVQDENGLLWIGTTGGLVTFDGFTATYIGAGESGLAGSNIVDLELDRSGILWISHEASGITRLNRSTMEFTQFRHDRNDASSLPSDKGLHVADFSETHIWIGLERETVVFMNKRDYSISYWNGESPFHPEYAVAEPPIIEYWSFALTAMEDGAWHSSMLHDPRSRVIDRYGVVQDSLMQLSTNDWMVISNCSYGNDLAFVGGWQPRLFIVNTKNRNDRTMVELGSNVTCSLPWGEDYVIVGTELNGLYLVNHERGTIEDHADQLGNLHVHCLLQDNNGKVWVGTDRGLHLYDPEVWKFNSVLLTPEQNITAGLKVFDVQFVNEVVELCTSQGIYRYNTRTGALMKSEVRWKGKPLQVTRLVELNDGTTILGAEEGFGVYNPDLNILKEIPLTHWRMSDTSQTRELPSLARFYQVRGITDYGSNGRFLVSALGYGSGVVNYKENTFFSGLKDVSANSPEVGALSNQIITAIDGTFWEATRNGVRQLEITNGKGPRTKSFFVHNRSDKNSLPGHDVRDLVQGEDGSIWVACADGGLANIRNGKVSRFPNSRTSGNSLAGLVIDEQQRIWCTSVNGLEVFDMEDSTFYRVPINDDALSTELQGPIARSASGLMATVSGNTLLTFDPASFSFDKYNSVPEVMGMEVSDEDITPRIEAGGIELSSNENFVKINTSMPWLRGEARPTIQYQLGTEVGNWHDSHRDGTIFFNSLAVGAHPLALRASFADGRTGPVADWGTITVLPPFYMRWWFIGSLILLAAAIAFAWHRRTLYQALKLQEVRNRIASDLHDEVGSSLSSISLGSQLAARLSDSKDQDVQKLLHRIGKTSSESLQSISDIVWAVDPKNDEGEALVKRMKRIGSELLETKDISFKLTVVGQIDELKLSMNARKNLLLIFKEAIHNASKYSDAQQVVSALSYEHNLLNLKICDNGKGFDLSLHKQGHGLSSMQRRANELGTTLHISSTLGMGTQVKLQAQIADIRD